MSEAIHFCRVAAMKHPCPDKFTWDDLPEHHRRREGHLRHPAETKIQEMGGSDRVEWSGSEADKDLLHRLQDRVARDLCKARGELGLDRIHNPLIEGHSYLTYWPIGHSHVSSNGDTGSRIAGEPAIIVAPDLPFGAIQQGAKLILFNAFDMERPQFERDYMSTTLQADVIILSNEQCRAWGFGMMAEGRIYVDYRPEPVKKN